MFAPRPFDVAKEMVRVTRPGGRIVMGNWIPDDPTLVAQILKISSAYSPPPPEGFVSPMTWGVEDERHRALRRRPACPPRTISFERDTYTFDYPGPPSEFVAAFRTYYGPTMNAFEAAEANGRAEELQGELEALFDEQNASPTKGHDLDPGDVPARHRRGLMARQGVARKAPGMIPGAFSDVALLRGSWTSWEFSQTLRSLFGGSWDSPKPRSNNNRAEAGST